MKSNLIGYLLPLALIACGGGDETSSGSTASGATTDQPPSGNPGVQCSYGFAAVPDAGLTEQDAATCNACAAAPCCAQITECTLQGAACNAESVVSCLSPSCPSECGPYLAVFDAALQAEREAAETPPPPPSPEPVPTPTTPPPANTLPAVVNLWLGTVSAHALQTPTEDWGFWDGAPDLEVCLEVSEVEVECLQGPDDTYTANFSTNFTTAIQSSDVNAGLVSLLIYDRDVSGREGIAITTLSFPTPFDDTLSLSSSTNYGLDTLTAAFY